MMVMMMMMVVMMVMRLCGEREGCLFRPG